MYVKTMDGYLVMCAVGAAGVVADRRRDLCLQEQALGGDTQSPSPSLVSLGDIWTHSLANEGQMLLPAHTPRVPVVCTWSFAH